MATFFRRRIAQKVLSTFEGISKNQELLVSSLVKVNTKHNGHPQFLLPVGKLSGCIYEAKQQLDSADILKCMRNQGLPTAEGMIDIGLEDKPQSFVFTFDKHVFNRIVLLDICVNFEKLAKNSCLLQNIPKQHCVLESIGSVFGRTIHLRHFHEFIRANFYGNVCELLGQKVTKLNFVDDWGPHSALVVTGFLDCGINEELEKNPITHLSNVVKASAEKCLNDDDFLAAVQECYSKMEKGDEDTLSVWTKLRSLWLKETKTLYRRMGMAFDDFAFASDIRGNINKYCDEILTNGTAQVDSDKKNIHICNGDETLTMGYNQYECMSPLYTVSRDIAEAERRKQHLDFDSMYYMSFANKAPYYKTLFKILENLGFSWSRSLEHLTIPSFTSFDGRSKIPVPLESTFHKVKTAILQELKLDLNLDLGGKADNVADSLAKAAMMTTDLKHKSNDDYALEWMNVVSFRENSGIAFQFYNAALLKLQEDSDIDLKFDIDLSPLSEMVALSLVIHLARFDEVILVAYKSHEPHFLHQYIDTLCYLTKKATDVLKLDIKEERLRVIKARLLLFYAVQKVLDKSLKVLLGPLDKL